MPDIKVKIEDKTKLSAIANAIEKNSIPLAEKIKMMFEREYKLQVPVDKGFTRRNVDGSIYSTGNTIKILVTTESYNRGFNYPVAVHEGTGIFKGLPIDFGGLGATNKRGYQAGRVRSGKSSRGVGGIRPNKFVNRTYTNVTPRAIKTFNEEINKWIYVNQFMTN